MGRPAGLSGGLGERLVGPDPVVGRTSEREVRELRDAALVPLLELIGRDYWESVPRAARLVGSIGERAVDPLCELLLDDTRDVGAARAFRYLRVPSTHRLAEILDRRRHDKPPLMTIRAFGEHGDANGAADLVAEARARDYEEWVVKECLLALERILVAQTEAREARSVLDQLRLLVEGITGTVPFPLHPSRHVFRLESGWLDPVIEALDGPPDGRAGWTARAAMWLGLSQAGRAVEVLGRLTANPEESADARIAAIGSLADNGQEGALEGVARASSSTAPVDRESDFRAALDAAAAALAWQSQDAAQLARDAIGLAAETGNATARAKALYVLGSHGTPDDRETLNTALTDPEWTVRASAGLALANLIGAGAIDRLRTAASEASEPVERLELATALALADPAGHSDALHELLLQRPVETPWALIDPIPEAIIHAFRSAGPPEGLERALAWAEVLNRPAPDVSAREAAVNAHAAFGPNRPIEASAPTGEPGRGTPHAQADLEATVDRLGRTPLVDILVGMLDDPNQGHPFTFGLFGGWGAGKSSVLRQLKTRLESGDTTHRFTIAWFNAWRYEKTDNLAAGLVQETVRTLVPKRGLGRAVMAWRFAWRTRRARLLWAILALVVSAAATVYGFVQGAVEDSLAKTFLGVGGLSVLTAIGTVLVRLYRHPVAAELWTYFRLPDYAQHLGLLPVMRDQLARLWDIRSGKDPLHRLVVVVDDLDRCSPDAIAATLDAVRLVMDLDRVIVIVALDERICLRAVAAEYEGLTTAERSENLIARDFLAKIVQLPIRLEPPESLDDFLAHDLFGGDGATAAQRGQQGHEPSAHDAGSDGSENVERHPGAPSDQGGRGLKGSDEARGRYSSDQVSVSAARLLRETMRETTPERDEFEAMAEAAGVRDPRQLRRLRNTYRFVKTNSASLDWRKLMGMLFWQECLHTLPAEQFDEHRGRPSPPWPPGDPIPAALAEVMARLFPDEDEFALYREAVLVAILPRLDTA